LFWHGSCVLLASERLTQTNPTFGRRGEQIREGEIIMLKKTLLMLAVVGVFSFATAQDANAWVYVRRVAPVRRAVARVVAPPYPMARRVIAGPVYPGPVIYGPSIYAGPGVYVGF
jgi:hypothetical protein